MTWTVGFFINSALFGVGLAMDAFSVSLANGLKEPKMKPGRMCLIAGVFGVFQTAMPLIGWFFVHAAAQAFEGFQKFIPWIALILLAYIGGKMLIEGIGECRSGNSAEDGENVAEHVELGDSSKENENVAILGLGTLLVQGIATAIDALSVGFTIADYNFIPALVECLIIGIVTFVICLGGISIGKEVGDRLSGKAGILGGVILIAIGIEIFVSHL